MNIYFDIDGVILINEKHLAIGAAKLIKYAVEHFDVYWLTTHCMDGDPAHAIEYVQRASEEDLRPWLEKFKPTVWGIKKTEAIDFTKPFLWLDDDCYTGEMIDLKDHGVENSWIEIDLRQTPDQMKKEFATLQAFTTYREPLANTDS